MQPGASRVRFYTAKIGIRQRELSTNGPCWSICCTKAGRGYLPHGPMRRDERPIVARSLDARANGTTPPRWGLAAVSLAEGAKQRHDVAMTTGSVS